MKVAEGLRNQLRHAMIFILGVRVDNIDGETAINAIRAAASRREGFRPRKVFFVNVHTIHLARCDGELLRCLSNADMVLPDGSGLKLAGRLFGTTIKENLNGTDLIPKVLAWAEFEGLSVYLLGGQSQVVAACRRRLLEQHPELQIVGYRHGYFLPEEEKLIVQEINRRRPDIVLVALGVPLQEQWIARNAQYLEVGVCIGVGGLFDFLSGAKVRAPAWMRRLGMEWLYRFIQDPRSKWYRVIVEIPTFFMLILARRFVPRKVQALFAREGLMQ
jgi:N-acetylglucosaminyldiphosphoundecaprenol N-acetyl-beta-D-mannosaminyltransferase